MEHLLVSIKGKEMIDKDLVLGMSQNKSEIMRSKPNKIINTIKANIVFIRLEHLKANECSSGIELQMFIVFLLGLFAQSKASSIFDLSFVYLLSAVVLVN